MNLWKASSKAAEIVRGERAPSREFFVDACSPRRHGSVTRRKSERCGIQSIVWRALLKSLEPILCAAVHIFRSAARRRRLGGYVQSSAKRRARACARYSEKCRNPPRYPPTALPPAALSATRASVGVRSNSAERTSSTGEPAAELQGVSINAATHRLKDVARRETYRDDVHDHGFQWATPGEPGKERTVAIFPMLDAGDCLAEQHGLQPYRKGKRGQRRASECSRAAPQ